IDEIDAIAPKREEVTGEVERRVVSQLLTLMDGLKSRGKVIVIGATNRPNAIDPALRRGGRFDREIEIGVPDKEGRKEIFQIHTRGMPLDKSVDIDKLAERTHGYVGADIAAVCKEAAMHALRRVLPTLGEIKEDKPLPAEVLKKLVVTQEDFEYALKFVEPSAMREVLIEKPNVRWDDIGDLENVKKELREAIEMPLKNPEAFQRMGIKPSRGILLFGPPGCGKTLLAKAVATESEANFILVSGPEIMSKWVGESEKKLREIFHKAKQVAPAIICFDEIDAIASIRGRSVNEVTERIVSQLLTLMSGVEELKDVFVIATTNRPDIIDPALLRPGRFDKQILIPVPDKEGRKEILKVHTRNMPLASDVNLDEIAEKTEGFSGADIEALCREAALNALRKDINAKEVTKQDFEEALKVITPSVSKEMNKLYERILKERKRSQAEETKKEIVYVE
ncbi:MAG: AAA family ATPase, partial [Candidatus Aenigmatarchaeota archaeon]